MSRGLTGRNVGALESLSRSTNGPSSGGMSACALPHCPRAGFLRSAPVPECEYLLARSGLFSGRCGQGPHSLLEEPRLEIAVPPSAISPRFIYLFSYLSRATLLRGSAARALARRGCCPLKSPDRLLGHRPRSQHAPGRFVRSPTERELHRVRILEFIVMTQSTQTKAARDFPGASGAAARHHRSCPHSR